MITPCSNAYTVVVRGSLRWCWYRLLCYRGSGSRDRAALQRSAAGRERWQRRHARGARIDGCGGVEPRRRAAARARPSHPSPGPLRVGGVFSACGSGGGVRHPRRPQHPPCADPFAGVVLRVPSLPSSRGDGPGVAGTRHRTTSSHLTPSPVRCPSHSCPGSSPICLTPATHNTPRTLSFLRDRSTYLHRVKGSQGRLVT